jgi:DNA-binding winged helix-turn-helix (wHTH) protein
LIYRFDDCVLDTTRRELRRGGELRPLEPQVFDLLEFLVRNRERVVGKEELIASIWRGRIVSDVAISTRINAVRKAIGDDGSAQRLVRTLRRRGFHFVGTVREGHRDDAPARSASIRHRLDLAIAGAPRLAICPFDCFSDRGASDLFVSGLGMALAEDVTAALWEIDWLPLVSPRPAVAGKEGSAQRIHARYLLQGSVRGDRESAHVLIRLVDGASGVHLWVERFRCAIADPPAFREEIAGAIAAVSDQIFAAECVRVRQRSPRGLRAWEAIVAALALINTRRREHACAAHDLLRKAIAIDGKSAPAFGLLSFVATLGVHQGWQAREAAAPLAHRAAARAIALDDEDPWSHLAAGYAALYVENRPDDAIAMFKHALALNPNLAMAHYLAALASAYSADVGVALAHADMAERLRSRDLLARGNVGAHDNVRATACFVAGRYREGIDFARRAIAQSPRQVSAYRQLVVNAALAGERRQAASALSAITRLAPDLQRFLRDSERSWGRTADYRRYVEAFRMVGHR